MNRAIPILVGALGLAAAIPFAGCAPQLCREPGPDCPCPDAARFDDVVLALLPQRPGAVGAGLEQLALSSATHDLLGLDDAPTVIVTSYDALGTITEHAAYNLAGEGSSGSRKEANAELAASCLGRSAEVIPTGAEPGNLVRALAPAADMAAARSTGAAAVIAFGLGGSSLDDPTSPTELPMSGIDLTSDAARQHVADVLTSIGQVPVRDDVTVVLVDPDAGVENSVVAGNINRFADGPLCGAISTARCDTVEVLP